MPRSLAASLGAVGHHCRMVVQIADPRISDEEILSIARENEEVVLTHDLDFGTLMAFSNADSPSVVTFRIAHINADVFSGLIIDNWKSIEQALEDKSIVVFQEHTIRIRQLPVNKGGG